MTERQTFFDVLKGIGIVYVFLGHELYRGSLGFATIFMFHMPLFFLVSGYFFDADSIGSARALFRRFLRNLLAPSLVFLAIAAVNAAIWGDLVSADHAVNIDRAKSFLRGRPDLLGSLWFVVCVIWSQLVVWLVSRIRRPFPALKRISPAFGAWLEMRWPVVRDGTLVVFMFILAYVLSKSDIESVEDIPLKLMSVPMCVVFVTLGSLARPWLRKAGRVRMGVPVATVSAAALLAVTVLAAHFGHRATNLCGVTYASAVPFILGSSAGILSSLALAKAFDRGAFAVIMAYVGRNSMTFFLLEGVVLMNITRFGNFLGYQIKFPLFLHEATMGWRIAMTAAGLIVCAALPPLINPVLRLVKRPFTS